MIINCCNKCNNTYILFIEVYYNAYYLNCIFFIIILPRILFIILFPELVGEYEIYTTIAENILNGCGISLSNPLTDECVPHFGGNHGPRLFFIFIFSMLSFFYKRQ